MEETPTDHHNRTREIKGVVCLALAVFLLLCLFSYSPQDPSFTRFMADGPSTHNLTGKFGSYTADSIIRLLGIASFLLPLALLACAFQYFLRPAFMVRRPARLRLFLFYAGLRRTAWRLWSKEASPFTEKHSRAGGLIGAGIVRFLLGYFNPAGTYIILIFIFIVSLFFIMEFSLVSVTEKFSQSAGGFLTAIKDRIFSVFYPFFFPAQN